MSLKEEIEKIIQSEKQELEARERKDKKYHEKQRDRFQPMRNLLEELVNSIEPAYLKARIDEDSAVLELGRKNHSSDSTDIRWNIEPNFGIRIGAEKGEGLFYEEPGFRVEETVYYEFPEYDVSENERTFETEQETVEYLVKKIAEKIAEYRHSEDLAL